VFSRTSEHALRAVLFIARHDGRPCTAEMIAAGLGAPQNYMSKTLHELARHGLLRSTRGPNGGFSLAIPSRAVTIGQIVDLFDTPRENPVCLLGSRPCNPKAPCAVQDRWTATSNASRAPLRAMSIAELLGGEDSPVTRPSAVA
jgi:Rrf2 family transcriptional regulator, nitric oxide-sensitive transcriptional repressor